MCFSFLFSELIEEDFLNGKKFLPTAIPNNSRTVTLRYFHALQMAFF